MGSEDARLWEGFARSISESGLIATYQNRGDFNPPPMMALVGWLSLEAARAIGSRFSLVFKLPLLMSDVVVAWLLWRIWRKKGESRATIVLALFSTSLVSILVSAYHCNSDSLCAAGCLASAYALHSRHWRSAGFLLGAAINVKLVPVMLVPVFMAFPQSRTELLRFLAGLVVWVIPFAALAWHAPDELLSNVLGYASSPFQWGLTYFMQESAHTLPRVSAWLGEHYTPHGRYILIGSMLLLGLLQRWRPMLSTFQAGALALAVFMTLIPGFGIQYLVWPAPLLFAAHPNWAARYAVIAGLFALLVYYLFWTGSTPWFSHFAMRFPPPAPLVGMLAWATLAAYSVFGLKRMLRRRC